jgi:hypothetical protein
MSNRSLAVASLVGTLLQVAMVVAGHSSPAIKGLFAVGGTGLSLVAGVLYARLARPTTKGSASLGGLAGGAITGAIGGVLGALSLGRAATAAGTLVVLLASTTREVRAQAVTPVVAADVRGDTTVMLRDFAWLTGRWEGTVAGVSGAVADVTYSAPKAGLMTGVMRLVKSDTVLVVELISMVDTPRGIELRFRHFSSSLEAYEREFKQTMRLTSHQPQSDTFENTVAYEAGLMSTQPRKTTVLRRGDDEFVGRSEIVGSDGKPAQVVSTYRRVR